jgi:ATP-dependent Clp protease adaptor protein ClpS
MNTDKQNEDQGQISVNKDPNYSLILYNDDFHSFDFVIDALRRICGMEEIQAAQCTYLIHFKDSCEVKRGTKSILLPMLSELIKLNLKAEIKQTINKV